MQIALAVGSNRYRPLDAFKGVWTGPPPHSVVAMSPFWDDTDDMPGAKAVVDLLAKRAGNAGRPMSTFVVAAEDVGSGMVVRAPRRLSEVAPERIDDEVIAVGREESDERRLHAKAVLIENQIAVAAMIGSSNLTAKGLGLSGASHREINVWFGCRSDSKYAAKLRALVPMGDVVHADDHWEPTEDEDEITLPPLPGGFVEALLMGAFNSEQPRTVRLTLDWGLLPEEWSIKTPGGHSLLDSDSADGRQTTFLSPLPDDVLPWGLEVSWKSPDGAMRVVWAINVADPGELPPTSELRDLPASVLLNVLASTRPLRDALEVELEKSSTTSADSENEHLDALKRFDSRALLLHRVRGVSRSLWGLEQRLARPLPSLEALDWRLNGAVGPIALARGLMAEVEEGALPSQECHFLLAELLLTVSRTNWVSTGIDTTGEAVRGRVQGCLRTITGLLDNVSEGDSEGATDGLHGYVRDVLAEAGVV